MVRPSICGPDFPIRPSKSIPHVLEPQPTAGWGQSFAFTLGLVLRSNGGFSCLGTSARSEGLGPRCAIRRRSHAINRPDSRSNDFRLISPSTFTMRRLFKSKSSADISTPTPRAKVVKQFSSRRDLRTLGATSSAVALSLGSAYYDVYDSSGDGPNVQDRDTGWQIAYGVARMAVEIAKESSDMLPPLKAVVSALSILITNYDVSVSYTRTEHPLILRLFLAPANVGQCGGREGDRAEGAVAIRCAFLSCERR